LYQLKSPFRELERADGSSCIVSIGKNQHLIKNSETLWIKQEPSFVKHFYYELKPMNKTGKKTMGAEFTLPPKVFDSIWSD
jgi:hypothetical protein